MRWAAAGDGACQQITSDDRRQTFDEDVVSTYFAPQPGITITERRRRSSDAGDDRGRLFKPDFTT
jgi:hypothetical protein